MRGSARWCEGAGGDYAWVFDNPVDTLAARLAGRPVIGFDVTEFLDHALTRSAVTLYLFHLVRQLLDGRRLVCWMDEFWRLLADPAFESFAKDGPEDLAQVERRDVPRDPERRATCSKARSAGRSIEQTPTKIFFPNADANCRGVHRGLRAHRARVPAHQGAARARVAHVPGEAGASQRRVPSWI